MWRTLAAVGLAATLAAACSDPAGGQAPPASATRAPRSDLLGGFSVVLRWDEATQTIHRKIGGVEYPKDDDLEKAIRTAHDVWTEKGKPDAPVTIDGDLRIPWKQVIHVVNIVKRCGIDKIEFAIGAPPKSPEGGK